MLLDIIQDDNSHPSAAESADTIKASSEARYVSYLILPIDDCSDGAMQEESEKCNHVASVRLSK